MKIRNLIRQHRLTFVKYGSVGIIGTAIDVLGFTGLVSFTEIPRNLAASISFLAAVINNYTLNRVWTFKSRVPEIWRQFGKFLLISILGLALNLVFLGLFSALAVTILKTASVADLPAWANASSKLSASAFVMVYNYLANRFITFHPRNELTGQ